MKGKDIIWLLIAAILSGIMVTSIKNYNEKNSIPQQGYRVYLEGKTIGYIKSRDELNSYINKQQEKLKDKYHVDTIYIPNNIDIVKEITYEDNFDSIEHIYNMINTISPFTIKGYQVTIDRTNSTEYQNDDNEEDNGPKITKINIINKEIFNKSIDEVILSFVDEDEYNAFKNQEEQKTDDQSKDIIENLYIEDKITIKEKNIPVNETIFMDSNALTKYLLFGDNFVEKKYIVKSGDNIEKIADNNHMGVNDLVIANNDLKSATSLIYVGQELSVSSVNPLITLIVEKNMVEEQVVKYKTVTQYDNKMYQGQTKVKQEGSNGKTRIVKKVKMLNGETLSAYIVSSEEIKPVVNRVIVRGGRQSYVIRGDGGWLWPTNRPYYISSPYGWRCFRGKCKNHSGIDIVAGGQGAPIYAARAGEVYDINANSSSGFYVIIKHDNGYYTRYAHMQNTERNNRISGKTSSATKYIKKGQRVEAHQLIGEIGCTGSCSGPHLHFEIWNGIPFRTQSFNPRSFY